jgi:hypothetical protein
LAKLLVFPEERCKKQTVLCAPDKPAFLCDPEQGMHCACVVGQPAQRCRSRSSRGISKLLVLRLSQVDDVDGTVRNAHCFSCLYHHGPEPALASHRFRFMQKLGTRQRFSPVTVADG